DTFRDGDNNQVADLFRVAEPYLGEDARVGSVLKLHSHAGSALKGAFEVELWPLQIRGKYHTLGVFVEASGKTDADPFEDEIGMSLHESLESGRQRLGCGPGMCRRVECLLREEAPVHIGNTDRRDCRPKVRHENRTTLVEAQKSWTPST